jgi:hypothetical protein
MPLTGSIDRKQKTLPEGAIWQRRIKRHERL